MPIITMPLTTYSHTGKATVRQMGRKLAETRISQLETERNVKDQATAAITALGELLDPKLTLNPIQEAAFKYLESLVN